MKITWVYKDLNQNKMMKINLKLKKMLKLHQKMNHKLS